MNFAAGMLSFFREICEFTEALKIKTENGRIKAVVTSRGEIETSAVLVATGAYTRIIAGWLGVVVPTKPVRHEILITGPLKPCLDTMIVSLHSGIYVRQTMTGEILGGSQI